VQKACVGERPPVWRMWRTCSPGYPALGAGESRLLMAHYDSASNAPGASDDAFSVAPVGDRPRAESRGRPLANDVISSSATGKNFHDGRGGLRRRAPLGRKDVGLALNFDPVGQKGATTPVTQPEQQLV